MFRATLFTVAKIWKLPKCPPTTDEWIIRYGMYTHTMKYYSTKKMNFCHLKQHGWIWRAIC